MVDGHPLADYDRATANQFGPSSVDFELVFHVRSADPGQFAQVRHEVMLAILRRFAELEIGFAYLTQTTFTAAPDGTLVMPYAPAKG